MAAVLYKWLMAFFLSANLHPFYIGVTEINYNSTGKSLEISCKVFTDDLETALTKMYKTKPDLFTPKDKDLAAKQVAGYIQEHLQIRVDGKLLTPVFLGFERENEAVWSYLEVEQLTDLHRIEIANSLLYDSFDQQINLVHVTVKGERKSAKLVYPDTSVKFAF